MQCQPHEWERYVADQHAHPPYQYKDEHCIQDKDGSLRLPVAEEREVILGFRKNQTRGACVQAWQSGSRRHMRRVAGRSLGIPCLPWASHGC